MKRISIFFGVLTTAVVLIGCSNVRRDPGTVYMPDMSYSRAYETYASTEALTQAGVNYTATPVSGTIARGEMAAYPYKNDSAGYAMSASVKNPLDVAAVDLKEAERLYLVNCGICHGKKLDGNGPLWNDGNGPYPSKPIALVGDAKYEAMAEGTMFHSLTYGKNAMGSYASQLSTKQRWMVITYVKSKQGAKAAPAADSTAKSM
ncbi:MAG: c-type cytochrome [Bacteroidota bacterium]|jgi:mono/diheme cytochrome c family protein